MSVCTVTDESLTSAALFAVRFPEDEKVVGGVGGVAAEGTVVVVVAVAVEFGIDDCLHCDG